MEYKEVLLKSTFAVEEASEFRDQLYNLIENGERNFVINFSKCKFIDSTGLGVLVAVYKRCKANGGNLKLQSISNQDVMKVFKLTRLDKVFELE